MGMKFPIFTKRLYDFGYGVQVMAVFENGVTRGVDVHRLGPGNTRLMSEREIRERIVRAKSVNKTVKACKQRLCDWYEREGRFMKQEEKITWT